MIGQLRLSEKIPVRRRPLARLRRGSLTRICPHRPGGVSSNSSICSGSYRVRPWPSAVGFDAARVGLAHEAGDVARTPTRMAARGK